MGITRQHVYGFNLVTRHFKVQDFIRADTTLLNEALATDHDEELPFGMVPMLAFGNSRFADVDAYLTIVGCLEQFCKTTPLVDVHLQRKSHLRLQ